MLLDALFAIVLRQYMENFQVKAREVDEMANYMPEEWVDLACLDMDMDLHLAETFFEMIFHEEADFSVS